MRIKFGLVLLITVFACSALAQDKVLYNVEAKQDTGQPEIVKAIQKASQKTAYSERLKTEKKAYSNPFAITLYKPNYILPFYFTSRPYQSVYGNTIPDKQHLKKSEFKAQISFKVPIWRHILQQKLALYAAYSQVFYWQLYTESPYFRETNYEPELFFSYDIRPWNSWNFGIVHQSNGRGGSMERSWNRVYADAIFSLGDFTLSFKPWVLIFKHNSSTIHNPDITKYLGHGRMLFVFTHKKFSIYLMARNNLESHFKRGAIELGVNFPIYGRFYGFVQGFSGYGQSLIEYDHYTNAVGVGIAFNGWT
ncbi:MAG: phospholipase A [Gammaproteobacteria bacterium]|nr:phospholipase A [Gammaproteobacteria bacterium]